MGHATRCIPIIESLHRKGHEVVLGTYSPSHTLYQEIFPDLRKIDVPGFSIVYPKKFYWISMSLHFLRFLWCYRQEKKFLSHLHETEKFDLIISDNRYGLSVLGVKCVLITHQLKPSLPELPWLILNTALQTTINRQILNWTRRFSEVWIPDCPTPSLAGSLVGKLPTTEGVESIHAHTIYKYIGWLVASHEPSESVTQDEFARNLLTQNYDYCALISGPEPHRSDFVRQVHQVFAQLKGKKLIIGGDPAGLTQSKPKPSWDTYHSDIDLLWIPCLNPLLVKSVLQKCTTILCRSGYTTLMELCSVGASQVKLVPTPGQSEQEYLASYLKEKKIADFKSQDQWDIAWLQEINNAYTGFFELGKKGFFYEDF